MSTIVNRIITGIEAGRVPLDRVHSCVRVAACSQPQLQDVGRLGSAVASRLGKEAKKANPYHHRTREHGAFQQGILDYEIARLLSRYRADLEAA